MKLIKPWTARAGARRCFGVPAVCLFTVLLWFGSLQAAQQSPVASYEIPPLKVPQPQFFCGSCHVLTYPEIIQRNYALWKKDKHNKVGCVACHYPPGTVDVPVSEQGHVPKKAPEHFSFLRLGGDVVRVQPRIVDASCMTANCHGRSDDPFKTKKIKFADKVQFVHAAHLDPKKQVEGQRLNCTTCHQRETDQKKFEVSKASCHLCHFKHTEFNQGRGKCQICHELPEKPIQTSGEKPITHEMLQKAGVACASCHMDVIQGAGPSEYEAYFEGDTLKTALVLGTGTVKRENCRSCHAGTDALKENSNEKLMHQKHVAVKNARCFDCHRPIRHALARGEPSDGQAAEPRKVVVAGAPEDRRTVDQGCAVCHPRPHRYQLMLASGKKREGVLAAPDPMHKARTNCFGCHVTFKVTDKGQRVLTASAQACVRCHAKDHEKMLRDWKTELSAEVKETLEVEQEALAALKEAEAELSPAKLAEAQEMLARGRENLNIVQFGNGVHNKKYSIMLIDAAITSFEDMMDFVEEARQ